MGGHAMSREEYAAKQKSSKRTALISILIIVGIIALIFSWLSKAVTKNVKPYEKANIKYECGTATEDHVYSDKFFGNQAKVAKAYHDAEEILGFPIYIVCLEHSNMSEKATKEYLLDFYEDHFNDDAHIVLGYFNDIDYWEWVIGKRIEDKFGEYELNLLIDAYYEYWDTDMNNESLWVAGLEYFLENNIVTEEKIDNANARSRKALAIALIAFAGAALVIVWNKVEINKAKREKEEREDKERMERMLSQPLETFGNQEVEDLKDKYD